MDIHRCFVLDGFETARFQKSRTKRSSKRLSKYLCPPHPNRLKFKAYQRKDAAKVIILYFITKNFNKKNNKFYSLILDLALKMGLGRCEVLSYPNHRAWPLLPMGRRQRRRVSAYWPYSICQSAGG